MKKLLVTTFITIVSLFSFATVSNALGLSIGVSGNQSVFAASAKETKTTDPTTGGTGRIVEEYGAFEDAYGSIFVEVSLNDAISIGVDYVPSSITTPENTNAQMDGGTLPSGKGGTLQTNKVKASFEDHTMAYLKFNLPAEVLGGGLYATLGVSQVDVITSENLGTGGAYPNTDTTGTHLGLGYERDLDSGIFVRAELMGSQYDDVKATNANTSNITVEVSDMIGATASIKVGKTF